MSEGASRVRRVVIIGLGLILAGWAGYYWAYFASVRTIDVYVTKTDRDEGRKRVFLKSEPGMLYNDDSLIPWKRDSGTLHGQIPDKSHCRLKIIGWRWPTLDIAPNLLEAECDE